MNGELWLEQKCEHGNVNPHYFGDDVVEFADWGSWVRCDRADCDLNIVRPGKVQCECDLDGTDYDTGFGPQGGERAPSCPGGFRRRVTINYEKAFDAWDAQDPDPFTVTPDFEAIIEAALEVGE